jgi:PDZ domain-containing protein
MKLSRIAIFRKEIIIVSILLFFPLTISTILVIPNYDEFTAPGDIVSVQEIGIEGSVYFTYVQSGYTKNWYEKLGVMLALEEPINFVPIEPYVVEEYEFLRDIEEEYKNDTIQNALQHASKGSEVYLSQFDERLEQIIMGTEDYYGDSLGLMLAIGLVEEMNGEDFSKGNRYTIAGTGTIEWDQTIGSIGGIKEKLLTAERNHVDHFLIPRDKERYYYEGLSNQEEAFKVAREEKLKLRIVPVDRLEDALAFLRSLPK